MKLYYSAGACSLGIHILLEEIGKPYEAQAIKLRDGEQYQPAFTAINPKSKVPTLVLGEGMVLTEYTAIASYLALTNPEAKLVPADALGFARALEAVDYAVATLHMQGFARLFRPTGFGPDPSTEGAVKARGREIIANGFAWFDHRLEGHDYVGGAYSIADSALFYSCFWGVALHNVELPPHVAAHYERMLDRRAVQRAMAAEGLIKS
jgi:glutathione S-transferase